MKRLSQSFRKERIRFWMLLAGLVLALLSFEEVVDDVFYDPLEGDLESEVFDQKIMSFMDKIRSPELTQIMTDLTALGSVSVVLSLFIVVGSLLAINRKFRGLVYFAVVLSGAAILPGLLKAYFGRARPDYLEHLATVSDLAFPSGHAFGATAVYIALAFYSKEYSKNLYSEVYFYVLAMMLILTVGFSRIYLGVHYPTDVLAGVSAGAIWALLVSAVFEYRASSKI